MAMHRTVDSWSPIGRELDGLGFPYSLRRDLWYEPLMAALGFNWPMDRLGVDGDESDEC